MADGKSNVLIFAELADGSIRGSAQELFGLGRTLAGDLGGSLAAAVIGSNVNGAAQLAGQLGADRVLTADMPALAQFTVDGHTRALSAAIEESDAALVLFSGTTAGRDAAAYLAAKHDAPHLVDAVDVRLVDGEIVVKRPVFQGKMLTEARAGRDRIVFVTVRSGSYPVPEADTSRNVQAEPLNVNVAEDDLRVKVEGLVDSGGGAVDLEAADIVVIGGRGLGDAEKFSMVDQLADAFGGAAGATRAVTDLGWRPHYTQVGQTGKQIAPKLYVGVGVSGAVQHTVGMRGSDTIVAINRDPDAPIFKLADFGIVGDLFEIVPKLTERIRLERGG